jgi:ribA/ribD-fused uncharacterized protein
MDVLEVEYKKERDIIHKCLIEVSSDNGVSTDILVDYLYYNIRQKRGIVNFYHPDAEYYQFSNFYGDKISSFSISYENEEWPTTEHAFQAAKFKKGGKRYKDYREIIRTANTPYEAFKLGRQSIIRGQSANTERGKRVNNLIRKYSELTPVENWDEIRDTVMEDILRSKFNGNLKVKEVLLSTGNAILRENSPRDSYWGTGGDGSGKNKLGILLMKIRDEIQETEGIHVRKYIDYQLLFYFTKIKNIIDVIPLAKLKKIIHLHRTKDYISNFLDKVRAHIQIKKFSELRCNIPKTNWVIPNKLLVGCNPTNFTDKLYNLGITHIISLQDEKGAHNYVQDKKSKYLNLPIPDRKIVDDETVIKYINSIQKIYDKKRSKIYIHCKGGHGRTGTIVALLLCKLFPFSALESLSYTAIAHYTRWLYGIKRKDEKILRSPQTVPQFAQVKRLCK